MAYDVELADRVREVVAALATGEVAEKRMFGGLAFLVGGHMAVAVSGEEGLLLRCPPERTDELVSTNPRQTGRFVMRGKELTGWLRIDPEAVAADDDLRRWSEIGVSHARSLPPK